MRYLPTRHRTRFTPLALAAGLMGLSQVGCAARDWVSENDKPAPVTPGDFIDESSSAIAVSAQPTAAPADAGPGPADGPPGPVTAPTDDSDQTYLVNAMIGHINGEAVYAGQILAPLDAQLAAMGRRDSGEAFLEQAGPLILGRLREAVIDKLVLGEAERDLTSRDRERLDYLVQQERDEKLRYYGQGSLAAAEANFEAAMGVSLSEHLRQYRNSLTVRRYIELTVRPKIVVNQRDVERFFDDNKTDFNRPASRAIRIMIAPDASTAQTIQSKLDAGESFEELATNAELNRYNAAGAGLFNAGEPFGGDFGVAEVNAALLELQEGEHAGPILANERHWFVELMQYTPERKTPFEEVKNQIEQQLRIEQFKFHTDRFRDDLIRRGNFTDLDRMMDKLIEVAVARYDSAG